MMFTKELKMDYKIQNYLCGSALLFEKEHSALPNIWAIMGREGRKEPMFRIGCFYS